METESLALWVITDGAAGNEAQALGLAEALARRRPAAIRTFRIAPRRWASRMPPRLWQLPGARAGGWPFTGYEGSAAALAPPWPGLAIGAGRRVAPLMAALRSVHRVRAVQILDPRMPPAAFDLVIAPEHDRLAAPNVLTTLGSVTRITPQGIVAEAERWRDRLARLPPRRVAVLLGGPGRGARWRGADARRFIAAMAKLSREGLGLMITPSRRSDPALVAALRAASDPAATFLWDGKGDNPYPAILGLAEAVVVTGDSVNMISEAATSGLPVQVFCVSAHAPKLAAFHGALVGRGIARDFTGAIERWTCTPLAEADRVAVEVLARFFPASAPSPRG